MKTILEDLEFVNLYNFLIQVRNKNNEREHTVDSVPPDIMKNIFVKHSEVPLVLNFKNISSLSELIRRCIRISLAQKKSNCICTGYIQSKNNSMLNCSPNTTLNILKSNDWKEILSCIGDELFIFLITECTLVQVINHNFILISGSLFQEIIPKTSKSPCISRSRLFYKNKVRINLDSEVIYNYITLGLRSNDNIFQNKRKLHSNTSRFYNKKEEILNILSRMHLGIEDKLKKISLKYKKLPLNSIYSNYFNKEKSVEEKKNLIDCSVNVVKLINFLFCISKKIFKPAFTRHNFRILKQKLSLLIYKNKYETLTEEELCRHFKINQFRFWEGKCNNSLEYNIRNEVSKKFIFYIFEFFYIPLISKYFYSTESGFSKLKVFYFPRTSWYYFSDIYIKEFIQGVTNAEETIPNEHSKPINIRCIPKLNGGRVIINLSKGYANKLTDLEVRNDSIKSPLNTCKNERYENKMFKHTENSSDSIKYYNSTNRQLISEYIVLKKEERCNLQNSMLGYEDMYRKLFPYLLTQNLYAIKLDITKCFDNIPHGYLKKLIEKCYKKKSYVLKSFTILEKLVSGFKTRKIYNIYDEDMPSTQIYNKISMGTSKIIKDDVYFKSLEREEMVEKVKKYILNNEIVYKNQIYKQIKGIPQGSIFSTLLCSLYLKCVDTKYFNRIIKKGIIIRYVDDFLILTPSKEEIIRFLKLSSKLSSIGLTFNKEKIEKNFLRNKTRIQIIEKDMVWCGIKFKTIKSNKTTEKPVKNLLLSNNLEKLKVNVTTSHKVVFEDVPASCNPGTDYQIVLKTNMKDNFNIFSISSSSSNIGQSILGKMKRFLNLRLDYIYFNKENLKIYENIYDILVLYAYRTDVLFKRAIFTNETFKRKILEFAIEKIHKTCRKRNISISLTKIKRISETAYEHGKKLM